MSLGSPEEQQKLIEELYAGVYRYCVHLLRGVNDAADATQDTFLKALAVSSVPSSLQERRMWIFTIARNVCFDRLRWWKRGGSFLFDSAKRERPAPTPPDGLRMIVEQALRQLSTRQYEVFVLRHWHGFSTAETAQLLSIDPGSVKSHLKRAVDRLQVELAEFGGRDNLLSDLGVDEV